MRKNLFAVILITFLIPKLLLANITIFGTVSDDNTSGNLEGVIVQLLLDSQIISTTSTSDGGGYTFANLDSNSYDLTYTHEDYFIRNETINTPGVGNVIVNTALTPKIVEANISQILVNSESVLSNPYFVENGDLLTCQINLENTGNILTHAQVWIWTAEIGIDPNNFETEWIDLPVGNNTSVPFSFTINDGFLNGTKNINYFIWIEDPNRTPDYNNYPESGMMLSGSFQLTSGFKSALISSVKLSQEIYQPNDEVEIGVWLKNDGQVDATFNLTTYISDVPQSESAVNENVTVISQDNIVLQAGEEQMVNIVNWIVPAEYDESSCYVFSSLSSQTGNEIVEYDKTINVFYIESTPELVFATAEHYRQPSTTYEIIPVDVSGVQFYSIAYYDALSAEVHSNGADSFISGYNELEYMIVTDDLGSPLRLESDTFRKVLFTSMGSITLSEADSYWLENLKQSQYVYNMAYRFRDIHDQLINEQIEYEEHTILLANIGQFFSGLGQSLVTGPMLAGKSLAEVTFKDEFILHSLTWTANEIAAYSGANSPNHVSVDPYEIPNISGEPESERLLLLITAFVFFTAADLAFEYFENQAEANLQDLVHQYDLIIPPLNRSVEYLNSSGAENAYNVGRSMYDKVINFRTHRPSYTNMTQYLGWGIDDPFGIATGDNSAAYFQYFLMGITEYLAYIDGLQSVDPNNSYSDLIVTMQGYIENLNQQSAQANWFNGAVYFESYSMGALGLSVMDQIDTHVFHQDGISIDLNLPNEVQSETLLAEIECYNYNGSINTANIIWNIEGTDLEGNFTNNGSGNYSAAIDVSSISDVAQASIYRLNIFAAVGAANVEGFRLFSVLPSTGIIHIVPDPGDMNAQDIGFQEFLSNNFSSQTISVSEFRYEVPNPALVPAIAIHNNSSTLPTYFSDSDFLASLTDYLDAGGNVVLFGNAVELLDVSGITNEMFNQYSNNHRIYITSV
ncbi:MAG: carboxypeptidase regulatory-like domain-containing protein, partial [Candidatus Marinimicrobia bacterium]|nr:carboxypeptidase regulatory-like domain-containing protein [Candidatus Neomarinimicrobiota bacterium]